MQSLNVGIKSFKYSYCDRTFYRSTDLKDEKTHERSHTNVFIVGKCLLGVIQINVNIFMSVQTLSETPPPLKKRVHINIF